MPRCGESSQREPIYQNDPQVVTLLQSVKAGHGLALPPVKVDCGDETRFGFPQSGPGQRDYCNKMPYAADRGTAIYAGGNHQVPHRMNDVWEYHLGSNTWHMLYAPDGGNPSPHKGAYFLTSRTLVANPDKELTDGEREQIAAYKKWWDENVVFQDGHLATKAGGPIMPAHTWDAFSLRPLRRTYALGHGRQSGGPADHAGLFHRQAAGRTRARSRSVVHRNVDVRLRAKKWIHYRTDGPHAALRGMGATMQYIPELKQSIWYVAAQNVSPAAYEMWLFDAVNDRWTELKPNGGQSISTLATKEQVAPMSEQQVAYSAKHRKLVAVLEQDTFVYDIDENEWSKAVHDERLDAHDARTVFAYDNAADVFLLASPKGKTKLAAFSIATGKWEVIDYQGDDFPKSQFGSYMGYYDPAHNVFAIQGRGAKSMWVYRHQER